jgi:antitoxin (DNA-binding transcriptional repressor) of toxin-antitoxin stability system
VWQTIIQEIKQRWSTVPVEVTSSGAVVFRLAPHPPHPHRVSIRYPAGLSQPNRAELEARYKLDLADCSHTRQAASEAERRTLIYNINDLSGANIKALLEDPRVEDASGFDVANFAVKG